MQLFNDISLQFQDIFLGDIGLKDEMGTKKEGGQEIA